MRPFHWLSIIACAALGVVPASTALADGGRVQFSQIVAPYRITVFTSPTPLRAGTIDISALVQQAESGEVVRDAIIDVELTSADAQQTMDRRATGATSTNKLLQSATLELPTAGRWHVAIAIRSASTVRVEFEVTAYESSSHTLTVAACLTAPLLVIALFVLREILAAGQRAMPIPRRPQSAGLASPITPQATRAPALPDG